MSYGEKKRVAIAGVLAMEPDILLLDEPTSNLDPRGRRELVEILRGLDKTMIVATHDVNAATLLTDRALVLNEMKLAEGALRDVFSQKVLLEKANLDIPDITKLFLSLRENGVTVDRLPLTIEEASKELLEGQARKGDSGD
jgi:cobalt/nickel transport system ATP-binding protein